MNTKGANWADEELHHLLVIWAQPETQASLSTAGHISHLNNIVDEQVVPYQHRCSLTLLAQYLDEHDRGKLFLFQKYAQDALVRQKQHPPQL